MLRSGLCALLAATATAATVMATAPAAQASVTPCVDDPGNTYCNGVMPTQTDSSGNSCFETQWAYVVDYLWYDDSNFVEYEVELWYSTKCQTNWTVIFADGYPALGTSQFSGKVRRYAGADGPYLMEHAAVASVSPGTTKTIASPMVWAPDNPAQSCLSLPPFTGSPDQIACTGEY